MLHPLILSLHTLLRGNSVITLVFHNFDDLFTRLTISMTMFGPTIFPSMTCLNPQMFACTVAFAIKAPRFKILIPISFDFKWPKAKLLIFIYRALILMKQVAKNQSRYSSHDHHQQNKRRRLLCPDNAADDQHIKQAQRRTRSSSARAGPWPIPAPRSPCRMGISVRVAKYMNAPTTAAARFAWRLLPPTSVSM